MRKVKHLLLLLFLSFCAITIQAAEFSNRSGKQTVAYIGLGNNNEDLAFAYYSNSTPGGKEIKFTLYGNLENISKVKFYARPYDATPGENTQGLSVTDASIWDYRDPVGKSNATLLGTIYDIPTAGTQQSFTTAGKLPAGDYMLYLTVDVKEDVVLKGLATEKAYIGGAINSIAGESISMPLINEGKSRVFVPCRKLLYAPGDYYSKYYRIPSIAKAADGSLIAISDARKYHIHDISNDIDILCRRSTDNGKSWSDPITIAQAQNGSSTNPDAANGYGDASLAALPNGDLICTMISGASLGASSSSSLTTNWYSISHDNGLTWSNLKQIDPNLYNNYRGCIAPGNMCVVKEGYLKGKVLAAFRSYATNSGGAINKNTLLVYDPETDKWSNITVNGSLTFASGSDECHLVEITSDVFLASLRGGSSNRTFMLLGLNSATNATQKTMTNQGMSLSVACNGDIVSYVDKNNDTYLLQTLPTQSLSSTRSNQTIFSVKNLNSTSRITWTPSFVLSDPLNARDETAQYSSMTIQNDNTLGIIEEEYPRVVRHEDDRGDFLLCSWYMNLRIEDIISDAVTPDDEQLIAPAITPRSTSYVIQAERPDIVITNPNIISGTTTYYTIYNYTASADAGESTLVSKQNGSFTEASKTIPWDNSSISEGTIIKVVAYCSKTGYANSTSSIEQYTFTNNLRNIKIVAMPLSGSGEPTITIMGLGQFNSESAQKIGVGKKITINAPGDMLYKFEKFTYDIYGNELLSSKNIDITHDNIQGYQISFNMPSRDVLPDNDADTLNVYVWYTINSQFGLMTEAYIYSGDESDYNGYKPENYNFDSNHKSFWCTNVDETTWPEVVDTNLNFGEASKTDNDASVIKFPQRKDASSSYIYGINVCLRVLPDNETAHSLNGIVMLEKDGTFLKDINGNYVYYLLNGIDNPYSENSEIYKNAKQVINWYQGVSPTRVDNCTFVASNEGTLLNEFNVIVYVVKSDLTSVVPLTNGFKYLFDVVHRGISSDIPTSVENIEFDGLNIIGGNGEALVRAAQPTKVTIYNVLGMKVIEQDVLNETSISLPAGIYIANGQKFIVK